MVFPATPAEGWRFERWEGDVASVADPARVTLNRALGVVAVFSLE